MMSGIYDEPVYADPDYYPPQPRRRSFVVPIASRMSFSMTNMRAISNLGHATGIAIAPIATAHLNRRPAPIADMTVATISAWRVEVRNQVRYGLVRRSSPNFPPGPWPQMKTDIIAQRQQLVP